MKFRRLTDNELAQLEKRFIQFLVANTITGDDWAKIKVDRPEEAQKLIDIFSEMMFKTSLQKIEFLKFSEPKEIKIFRCGQENITLMGLVADDKTPVDFTQPFNTKQIMQYTEGLSIYRSEKKYASDREQELFKMMESGCLVTDGLLFGMLEKIHD